MKKYLVLIAGAAVAYSMVGAAASTLTVTQATIPAQGVDGTSPGACTSSVYVQYTYLDGPSRASDAAVTIDTGGARYVNEIIVAAGSGNSCSDDPAAGDFAVLSFGGTSLTLAASNVVYASSVGGAGITAADGGWVFELDTPVSIENFDPGYITVTIYRDRAAAG